MLSILIELYDSLIPDINSIIVEYIEAIPTNLNIGDTLYCPFAEGIFCKHTGYVRKLTGYSVECTIIEIEPPYITVKLNCESQNIYKINYQTDWLLYSK